MKYSETIYIVEDDNILRAILADRLIKSNYQVSSYSCAQQFIDAYNPCLPGCLLLDINLPAMSGLELQQELIARDATIPIIFLTGHADVSSSVQALKAGAVDFLEKPFKFESLLASVEQAIGKDRMMRAISLSITDTKARFSLLTEREYEVLEILVSGAGNVSNKVIAKELGISYRTVDHHRARIMQKTNAGSVTELCLLANKAGLVSL